MSLSSLAVIPAPLGCVCLRKRWVSGVQFLPQSHLSKISPGRGETWAPCRLFPFRVQGPCSVLKACATCAHSHAGARIPSVMVLGGAASGGA